MINQSQSILLSFGKGGIHPGRYRGGGGVGREGITEGGNCARLCFLLRDLISINFSNDREAEIVRHRQTFL